MLKEEFFQSGTLPAPISILVSLLQFMSTFMLKEEYFQWGRLCGRSNFNTCISITIYFYVHVEGGVFSIGGDNVDAPISMLVLFLFISIYMLYRSVFNRARQWGCSNFNTCIIIMNYFYIHIERGVFSIGVGNVAAPI